MKTNTDPRHLRRIRLIKSLYSHQFAQTKTPNLSDLDNAYFQRLLKKIAELNVEVDRYSKRFGVEKMAKIDLSILQLGVFELLFNKETPAKVVMDEAIELAKEFGSTKSPALINGILASIYEHHKSNGNT